MSYCSVPLLIREKEYLFRKSYFYNQKWNFIATMTNISLLVIYFNKLLFAKFHDFTFIFKVKNSILVGNNFSEILIQKIQITRCIIYLPLFNKFCS